MARITIADLGRIPQHEMELFETVTAGTAVTEQFGECRIICGLDKNMVSQLISLSNDTSDGALAFTSDRKRFADEENYISWLRKGRTLFALVNNETGDLMALVWFGAKKPAFVAEPNTETVWETIAYRSYPPYRGGGFMTTFVSYTIKKYAELHQNVKLWARIRSDNVASQALAEKLGFTPHEKDVTDAGGLIFTR